MHDGLGGRAKSQNAVSAVVQERRCSEAQRDGLGCTTLTTAEANAPRESVPQNRILRKCDPAGALVTQDRHMFL